MADARPDVPETGVATIRAAVPELERLIADPLLGDGRTKLFLSRLVECVRDLYRAAGFPLDPDELQALLARERDYVAREVDRLERVARGGADGPTLRAEVERVVWVVWRKSVRWRRGGGLTRDEQAAFAELFRRYDQSVVDCVRARLRRVAQERVGATASAVAQSVWESAIGNHPDEVDLSQPDSVWPLLLDLGRRHCEKWNKAAQRHPQDSLDSPAGRPGTPDTAAPLAATLPEGGPAVEDEVILRECVDLLRTIDPGVAGDDRALAHLAANLPDADAGIGLWKQLTPSQRSVLVLKMFNRTAAEIAEKLGVTQAQVNYAWNCTKDAARAMRAS